MEYSGRSALAMRAPTAALPMGGCSGRRGGVGAQDTAVLGGGAEQVVQNVNYGADVAFGTALSVLQRRIQCT